MLLDAFYIQMYSLRDDVKKEGMANILQALAKMGYTGVEFAGFGDLTPDVLAQEMPKMPIKTLGAHMGKDDLILNLEKQIQNMKTLGGKYVICPHAPIRSALEARYWAPILNEIGKKVTDAGLVFAYHNHGHEFTAEGGVLPFDVLMAETDPAYVQAEIDVYWTAHAGVAPLDVIRKYKGRCPLIHMKQIGADKTNVCLPDGLIDMKQVILTAQECGAEAFVLEQEEYPKPPMECAKIAIDYIYSL